MNIFIYIYNICLYIFTYLFDYKNVCFEFVDRLSFFLGIYIYLYKYISFFNWYCVNVLNYRYDHRPIDSNIINVLNSFVSISQ